jgi:hypothetical protein
MVWLHYAPPQLSIEVGRRGYVAIDIQLEVEAHARAGKCLHFQPSLLMGKSSSALTLYQQIEQRLSFK